MLNHLCRSMFVTSGIVVLALAVSRSEAVDYKDGRYHRLDGPCSYINIYDGFWGPTTVEVVAGGVVDGDINVRGSSFGIVSGGALQGVNARFDCSDNAHGVLSAGLIDGYVQTRDDSHFTLSGGRIVSGNGLSLYDRSSAEISGGQNSGRLYVGAQASATLSGGTTDYIIYVIDRAHLTVVGSDFAIDGSSVGYATFTGGQHIRHGRLTGTLLSGDGIDNDFVLYPQAALTLVPEPATLLLLAFGGMGLLIRRRRNGR